MPTPPKKLSGDNFEREKNQNIFYEGITLGTRRVDFLVEEKILIELKAITQLENVHLAQAINYIAFELEVGLLINFGATSLQFRRLQNNHKVPHQRTSTNQ
jgi:GxxExxY protein